MAKKQKRKATRRQPQSIISDEIFIPNHSGDHSAGTTDNPINPRDIANKKYVDDEIAAIPGGVTDHGALNGLSDDDHTQYTKKASTETISGLWTWLTNIKQLFRSAANYIHSPAANELDIVSPLLRLGEEGDLKMGSATVLYDWYPVGDKKINWGKAGNRINDSAFGGDMDNSGNLIFTGSGKGLPHGEIYVNDNTTVTSVSNAGFTQFLHFDSNGHASNATPDHTADHITVDKAGVYMVDCCVNVKNSSGNAHVIEVVVAKNNGATIFANMRRHRTLGTGTDVAAIPLCGHLDLAVNDTIEVWITSDSASARNITGEDVVLMLTMVGGT